MSNLKLIQKNIKAFAQKGRCIVYDVVDLETGEVTNDSAVSLDLSWIKPSCSSNPAHNGKWHKIVTISDNQYGYVATSGSWIVPISEKVIELVNDY